MSYRKGRSGIRTRAAVATAAALLALDCSFRVAVATAREAGEPTTRQEADEQLIVGQPVVAIVSLRNQTITAYDADGRSLRAPVSSGKPGYETPAGIYSILQKEAEHTSNLYDDASMPFMQRITWSGIALHAGALPGHPASHGCVRMPLGFSEQLFGLTKLGMKVVISRHDIVPMPIAHPALFQPSAQPDQAGIGAGAADPSAPSGTTSTQSPALRRIEALKAAADAARTEIEAATRTADARRLAARQSTGDALRSKWSVERAAGAKTAAEARLQAALRLLDVRPPPQTMRMAENAVERARAQISEAQSLIEGGPEVGQRKAEAAALATQEAQAADDARVAAIVAARGTFRRLKPISVFISRREQRLYVRQAFAPVMDVPVLVREPDKPIGTHLYLAVGYIDTATPVRWTVMSFAQSREGASDRTRRKQSAVSASSEPANAALDRIDIPKEARDLISDVVAPGSSLIISDEEMSKETMTGTDFVVLMSGEPQGGIKIRRRNNEVSDGYSREYSRALYRSSRRRNYGENSFPWW